MDVCGVIILQLYLVRLGRWPQTEPAPKPEPWEFCGRSGAQVGSIGSKNVARERGPGAVIPDT